MKIEHQFHDVSYGAVPVRVLDRHLERLDRLIPISVAQVVLRHRTSESPAFFAFVDLAVPGPDIHAAARDHALEAVVLKVGLRLEEQIKARKSRQHLRRRRREHCRVNGAADIRVGRFSYRNNTRIAS